VVAQPVKNFPAFHRTQRSINVFTRTRYWYLSWARCTQSIPLYFIYFVVLSNIILLSTLVLTTLTQNLWIIKPLDPTRETHQLLLKGSIQLFNCRTSYGKGVGGWRESKPNRKNVVKDLRTPLIASVAGNEFLVTKNNRSRSRGTLVLPFLSAILMKIVGCTRFKWVRCRIGSVLELAFCTNI
jgi:hypothetical protein